MAEFLDPAYLRQHLSFWLLEQMGVPSPYFYPVRAQLNGAFYGLVFHNDVIDEEQVERMGYDPAGALYKAAGQCIPAESSTGVFEKKAPQPLSDHTDYQTLVRAINETNTLAGRRIAALDMLDLPEVINYLAGARWCAENDDVWANMSLYRDTYGDQLWRIIPFDMNASWGQRYGGITPLDAINDNCKSHPLYGGYTIIACDGSVFNRVYDVVIQVPELRQMLLRRERTVLDRWVLEPGIEPQSRL
jgi:spore coat protein CotH